MSTILWTDVPPEMRQMVIDTWAGTHADAKADTDAEPNIPPAKRAWLALFDAANVAAIAYLAAPGGLTAKAEGYGDAVREHGGVH